MKLPVPYAGSFEQVTHGEMVLIAGVTPNNDAAMSAIGFDTLAIS